MVAISWGLQKREYESWPSSSSLLIAIFELLFKCTNKLIWQQFDPKQTPSSALNLLMKILECEAADTKLCPCALVCMLCFDLTVIRCATMPAAYKGERWATSFRVKRAHNTRLGVCTRPIARCASYKCASSKLEAFGSIWNQLCECCWCLALMRSKQCDHCGANSRSSQA